MFENSNNKMESDKAGKYQIINTRFEKCEAHQGGAVYLDDAQFINIEDCYFNKNRVTNSSDGTLEGIGGCVQYYCNVEDPQCDL